MTPDGQLTDYQIFPYTSGTAWFGDLAIAADGVVWFIGGDKVGRINTDGSVEMFDTPESPGLARQIAIGSDGNVWFTNSISNSSGEIVRRNSDGTYATFPVTSNVGSIARIGDDIWFSKGGNTIALTKMNIAGAEIASYAWGVPPMRLVLGSDNNVWFPSQSEVARMSQTGTSPREYIVPGTMFLDVTIGPGGDMWAVGGANKLVKISPLTNGVTQLSLPANATPGGITSDGTYLWVTEGAQSKIAKLSTNGSILAEFPLNICGASNTTTTSSAAATTSSSTAPILTSSSPSSAAATSAAVTTSAPTTSAAANTSSTAPLTSSSSSSTPTFAATSAAPASTTSSSRRSSTSARTSSSSLSVKSTTSAAISKMSSSLTSVSTSSFLSSILVATSSSAAASIPLAPAPSNKTAKQSTAAVFAALSSSVRLPVVVQSSAPQLCGNGKKDLMETCDDMNAQTGDGCDNCQMESGWQCAGTPSMCARLPAPTSVSPSAASEPFLPPWAPSSATSVRIEPIVTTQAPFPPVSANTYVAVSSKSATPLILFLEAEEAPPPNLQQNLSICGNGKLEVGEECDDGVPSATCDASCHTIRTVSSVQTLTANASISPVSLAAFHLSAPREIYSQLQAQIIAPLHYTAAPPTTAASGPGAIVAMAAGAGVGIAYVRRKRKT